jgi:AcrR family transcriptional regulator
MSSEPIWLRPEPGGRRPSLTRDRIAAVAVEIADNEGFEAVSMRNVARALGVGTMSLYHYIRTKDDLLALMDDRLMAEVVVPDGELPDDWREALAVIARRSYAAWSQRPWTLYAMQGARIGPNGMKHMEQSLHAVSRLGLTRAEQLELISLVDDYAIGFSMRQQELPMMQADDWAELDAMTDYMTAWIESGDYPNLKAFAAGQDAATAWREVASEVFDEDRFERGLQTLLDGIDLRLKRRQ